MSQLTVALSQLLAEAGIIAQILAKPEFAVFVLMLVNFALFHKIKNFTVVTWGLALLALYYNKHGSLGEMREHFTHGHLPGILYNLAGLIPGYAIMTYLFGLSGFDKWLAKRLRHDWQTICLCMVFSAFADNILAALVFGKILKAQYGAGNVPFKLIPVIVAAANLGGAPSCIGDTTTIMLVLSGVSKWVLLKGYAAVIPDTALLCLYGSWHKQSRQSMAKISVRLDWTKITPVIAGTIGVFVGNVFYDQPALGLWLGFLPGLVLGKLLEMIRTPAETFQEQSAREEEELVQEATFREVVWEALSNTFFLLALIATAELLPLKELKPILERHSRNTVSVALGVLSGFFDNIPLTMIAIGLGGFDWALLAYNVGFGGSVTWFGSSAAIAMILVFKEAHDTKKWIVPGIVIEVIHIVGSLTYMFLASHGFLPNIN